MSRGRVTRNPCALCARPRAGPRPTHRAECGFRSRARGSLLNRGLAQLKIKVGAPSKLRLGGAFRPRPLQQVLSSFPQPRPPVCDEQPFLRNVEKNKNGEHARVLSNKLDRSSRSRAFSQAGRRARPEVQPKGISCAGQDAAGYPAQGSQVRLLSIGSQLGSQLLASSIFCL